MMKIATANQLEHQLFSHVAGYKDSTIAFANEQRKRGVSFLQLIPDLLAKVRFHEMRENSISNSYAVNDFIAHFSSDFYIDPLSVKNKVWLVMRAEINQICMKYDL